MADSTSSHRGLDEPAQVLDTRPAENAQKSVSGLLSQKSQLRVGKVSEIYLLGVSMAIGGVIISWNGGEWAE